MNYFKELKFVIFNYFKIHYLSVINSAFFSFSKSSFYASRINYIIFVFIVQYKVIIIIKLILNINRILFLIYCYFLIHNY